MIETNTPVENDDTIGCATDLPSLDGDRADNNSNSGQRRVDESFTYFYSFIMTKELGSCSPLLQGFGHIEVDKPISPTDMEDILRVKLYDQHRECVQDAGLELIDFGALLDTLHFNLIAFNPIPKFST